MCLLMFVSQMAIYRHDVYFPGGGGGMVYCTPAVESDLDPVRSQL